jgi:hypothetical protein
VITGEIRLRLLDLRDPSEIGGCHLRPHARRDYLGDAALGMEVGRRRFVEIGRAFQQTPHFLEQCVAKRRGAPPIEARPVAELQHQLPVAGRARRRDELDAEEARHGARRRGNPRLPGKECDRRVRADAQGDGDGGDWRLVVQGGLATCFVKTARRQSPGASWPERCKS